MKILKMLCIDFDNDIQDYELPAYRAAISNEISNGEVLFHHHIDNQNLLIQYPLIQYKLKNKKLSVLFLENATQQIYKFLTQEEWNIKIGKEDRKLKVKKINIYQSQVGFAENKKDYILHNWLALNEDNYKTFQETKSLISRVELLERILKAHLLAFGEGVHWHIDKNIDLCIIDIHKQKWVKYKKVPFLAFDVSFHTNMILPDFIGVGKSSSVGFGVINSIKYEKKEKNLVMKS